MEGVGGLDRWGEEEVLVNLVCCSFHATAQLSLQHNRYLACTVNWCQQGPFPSDLVEVTSGVGSIGSA